MSKSVEDYVKEMTLEDFLKHADDEGICPLDLGLDVEHKECNNTSNDVCNECMRKAVEHITFKQPVAIMEQYLPVLQLLRGCEEEYKRLDDDRKKLKEKLQQVMEQYGITKWENEEFSISYVAEGKPSTSVDSAKLKKKYPDIYEDCSKQKAGAKAYVKFNLKGVK